MERWQSLIDQQLEAARKDGAFDNLPSTGKPLNLGDDPNTPDEMKLAYKILKENDLIPAWIEEGKELDAQREKLVAALRRDGRADAALRTRIDQYNKRILTHNLKLPPGLPHKRAIHIDRELSR
jgi:hypothetical protein